MSGKTILGKIGLGLPKVAYGGLIALAAGPGVGIISVIMVISGELLEIQENCFRDSLTSFVLGGLTAVYFK